MTHDNLALAARPCYTRRVKEIQLVAESFRRCVRIPARKKNTSTVELKRKRYF